MAAATLRTTASDPPPSEPTPRWLMDASSRRSRPFSADTGSGMSEPGTTGATTRAGTRPRSDGPRGRRDPDAGLGDGARPDGEPAVQVRPREVGQQHPARGGAQRGEPPADRRLDPQVVAAVRLRDVDDVPAVEDRELARLPAPGGDLVHDGLAVPDHVEGLRVGVAELEDPQAEAEPVGVVRQPLDVLALHQRGEQLVDGRAGQPEGGRDLGRGQVGASLEEQLEDVECANDRWHGSGHAVHLPSGGTPTGPRCGELGRRCQDERWAGADESATTTGSCLVRPEPNQPGRGHVNVATVFFSFASALVAPEHAGPEPAGDTR